MPSYLSLVSWTEQGVKNIKDAPARIDAYKQSVADAGGRLIFFYMLMGDHDIATLIEVPNDETAARVLLNTARLGNVRSQTYRAFTEDESKSILNSLA